LEKFNKFNSNFSLFLDFQKKDDDQYSNLHKYYVPNKGSFWMKVPKPMMMCRLEQSYAENKDSDYGTVSMFFPDDYNYFFNLCKEELAKYHETTITPKQYEDFGGFRKIPDYLLELFIRTCLSRVNGEAVLGVFEGIDTFNIRDITYLLYNAFEWVLYYGKPLDEAIQALHEKLLELVPEYVEFLKNNNK